MARPWIRRINRGAIAVAVIAVLAVPWAFPAVTTAVVMTIGKVIPPLSLPLIVLLAVEATLVLLAAIWWLWWRLPKRQVRGLDIQIHDPKARADTEDNFRKTVGQALGGAAVLLGAAAAYLQFTQQQRAGHDLLISNQVSKGFEQLASKELVMRLGGIYALEGVMNTSEQYYQPVLEALCAFVWDDTLGKIVSDRPATDIQAALNVIGRRSEAIPHGSYLSLAGAGANVPGVDLSRAKLFHANLFQINLRGANLAGADLGGTRIEDSANLGRADLSAATLFGADLRYAMLAEAKLSRASLFHANLSHAVLVHANLRGAVLHSANLVDAIFDGADLGDASGLTQAQLDEACGTDATPPPGLTLQPCGPREKPVAPALNRSGTP